MKFLVIVFLVLGLALSSHAVLTPVATVDFTVSSIQTVSVSNGQARFLVHHQNIGSTAYYGPIWVRFALFNSANHAVQYFSELYHVNLLPGASFSTSIDLDGISNGHYSFRVTDDSPGLIVETNETNNTRSQAFVMANTVLPTAPDFVFEQGQFSGTDSEVTIRIKNKGTAAFSNEKLFHAVEFYSLRGHLVLTVPVNATQDSYSIGESHDYLIPYRLRGGTYMMKIIANSQKTADEISFSNNSFSFLFNVLGSPPQSTDFSVD